MKSAWAIAAGTGMLVASAAILAQQSAVPAAQDKMRMIAACATCHGSKGEGIEARSAPRLAGIQAAYLAGQLSAFAQGKRGAHQLDRFGPQMTVIAKTLKPADIALAADHYAKLGGTRSFRTIKGNVQKGAKLYETCASCHGSDGMGIAEAGAPRIAGQADWYVEYSLRQFKSGVRGVAADDAPGQAMAAAAGLLANDQEIRDVAAYSSSLRGE